jgi:hypothetical protein
LEWERLEVEWWRGLMGEGVIGERRKVVVEVLKGYEIF